MNIKNPLDKDLKLCFKGVDYEIKAGEVGEFPQDVSDQWIYIYGFLKAGEAAKKVENKEEKDEEPKKKVSKRKAKDSK